MHVTDVSSDASRRAVLSGSLAALALAVAGCSRAAGGGPASAERLTVGIPADIVPANLLRQVAVNFPVRSLVFDTLVGLDRRSREIVPRVATSWRWNTDRTKLTVTLRDNVRFHDGRPFGPKDVQFAIRTAADPANGSQVAAIAGHLKSVDQTGDHEVTFTLTSPIANFLDLLLVTPLVDARTISGVKTAKQVVGTGPFAWKSWTPGNRVELTRNPHYWKSGRPYPESVTLRVFTQAQALTAALRADEIDAAYQMIPRDAALFAKDDRYEVFSTAPTFTDWYLGVNVSVPPFTDVRVRQAIAWAVDRERIARQVFSGFGTASCLPALDTFPGLTTADNTRYSHDPVKAWQLLHAAGAVGKTVPIVANGNNKTAMEILNIVQYNLEGAGLKVTPTALDAAAYQGQVQKAAIRGLWIGPVDLASISIATLALGNPPFKVKGNSSHVTDPAYAKLAGSVVNASTDQARAAANRAYMDYVLDQAFHLTLVHGYYVAVVRKPLSGVTTTGTSDLDLAAVRAA
ncbi:hypothetical protein Acsp03_49970 [Actinomadura sp. NBRC 104412]|uniref:ABC transporter substrate-binding protein n=1 Tax=Actinomadura sp. NBRC 104412 TaxID=3032203 RepID=UPI0024A55985|nr:ABC transporter substrate-binding protein [Actinomadura sp. NBRC 104412]GLZ07531.1 hypothetical protein Acsp03_49970 [Actinomadura sp. NBRC 104412]